MNERAVELLKVFGLEAEKDIKAANLPYGKQRKLEIARALATNPKLLLLDEPAAGLNPAETDELSHMIRQLRDQHQVTVLLIEHDMSLVMKISGHIVVLDHGEVICAGGPEKVANDPRVIAAYLGSDEPEVSA